MIRPIARRSLLGAAALIVPKLTVSGLTTSGLAWAAAPASLPARPMLLVAGPADSAVGRWAEIIAPVLGRSLGGGETLPRENVGGADGVTGVNQFQARSSPDGTTALVLPGTALLASLVGDTRVRFDVGSWAPLWGGSAPAFVAARVPLVPGARVRIAANSLVGPELAALLALHMMGVDAVVVPRTGADRLLQRDVDAAFLRGVPSPERLAAGGWRPAFALPAPGVDGSANTTGRLLPAHELFAPSRAGNAAMLDAFRAVCAAATLDVGLVLPAVAPAAVVAWWRRGCDQLDDQPEVRAAATASGLLQDDTGRIAAQLSLVSPEMPATLALRTLLAERYGWRPS